MCCCLEGLNVLCSIRCGLRQGLLERALQHGLNDDVPCVVEDLIPH